MEFQNQVRTVVFNLGGVVVKFDSKAPWHKLKEIGVNYLDPRNFEENFNSEIDSYTVRERAVAGLISSEQYIGAIQKLSRHDIPADKVREILNLAITDVNYDVIEILQDLRKKDIVLACLSNVDEIHWKLLVEKYNIDSYFDLCFCSYNMKLVKPNPEIFDKVQDDLSVSEKEIFSTDDNPNHIDCARRRGWHATQFVSHEYLRSELKSLGINVVRGEQSQRGPFAVETSSIVYGSPWLTLHKEVVRDSNGHTREFGRVSAADGVAVLPVYRNSDILLAREFRYALATESLEAFSGGLDPSEAVIECAKRELHEESGYETDKLISIGSIDPFTSLIDARVHLFLAYLDEANWDRPDEADEIETVRLSILDAQRFISDGTISHAPTQILIFNLINSSFGVQIGSRASG